MLPLQERFALQMPKLNEAVTKRVTEALLPAGGSGPALEVTFAAIHEGLTRNNTFYSKEGLTNREINPQGQPGGIESWTKPYGCPILKNHDSHDVDNTIGRVVKAEWVEKAGKEPGHVQITARITHPESIEKFMRGEYQTGSIGMEADKATCSICGADFMKGWQEACSHERGKWYTKVKDEDAPSDDQKDGRKGYVHFTYKPAEPNTKGSRRMHINVGNVWAREYSVVAVPSDSKSRVKNMELKEAYLINEAFGEPINLLEQVQIEGEIPSVDKDGNPVVDVNAEKILMTKVTELQETLMATSDYSPVNDYLENCLALTGHQTKTVTIENEQTSLEEKHLEKNLSLIEDAFPELDSELNAIKEAVLSSMKNTILPDGAFGLVSAGDEKLRLFAYKTEEGAVDQTKLLLALAYVNSAECFTPLMREKAIRRLTGVAKKTKIGVPKSAEEAIVEAKELVEEFKKDVFVLTAKELEDQIAEAVKEVPAQTIDEQELKTKLDASEASLAEANRILLERENEVEELLEKVEEAKGNAESSIKEEQTKWVGVIVEALGLEGDEASEKIKELSESKNLLETLGTTLEEKVQAKVAITTKMNKTGLALGTNKNEHSNESAPLTTTTMLSAFLGSKTATAELFAATKNLRNPE